MYIHIYINIFRTCNWVVEGDAGGVEAEPRKPVHPLPPSPSLSLPLFIYIYVYIYIIIIIIIIIYIYIYIYEHFHHYHIHICAEPVSGWAKAMRAA